MVFNRTRLDKRLEQVHAEIDTVIDEHAEQSAKGGVQGVPVGVIRQSIVGLKCSLPARRLWLIWVYGVGEHDVWAFTYFGIENLIELVRMHKENPAWLKGWQPQ
jgi:hypothetical protein